MTNRKDDWHSGKTGTYSSIVQQVEQRTVNPCVTGSSPVGGAPTYQRRKT